MANILDKFKETSIGSSGRIIDYNSTIESSGDFTKIYDLNAILMSWKKILTTTKGSMNHDPEFGSNLYSFIFEPVDKKTQESIKNDIIRSLTTYDDRANIESVDVLFLKNKKGFVVNLTANYYGYKSKLTISFDENSF